jgi:hypothetical protein
MRNRFSKTPAQVRFTRPGFPFLAGCQISGIFLFWRNGGSIPAGARRTSMPLIANDVISVLCEHGKQRGLDDPFQVPPDSRKLPSAGMPEAVAGAEALNSRAGRPAQRRCLTHPSYGRSSGRGDAAIHHINSAGAVAALVRCQE